MKALVAVVALALLFGCLGGGAQQQVSGDSVVDELDDAEATVNEAYEIGEPNLVLEEEEFELPV